MFIEIKIIKLLLLFIKLSIILSYLIKIITRIYLIIKI